MKKIGITTLLFLLLFTVIPTSEGASDFSDVLSTHLNYTAIMYLRNNNIVRGYNDNTFRPDNTINRAEFIKIVVMSLTTNPQGTNCFSDVKNEWYARFVCEAKQRGLISGYADHTFRPNESIIFSDASKVVVNAFGVPQGTGDGMYWFKPFIVGLEGKKAIPLSIDYFDKELTRSDMAEMIYRLKANIMSSVSKTYNEINGEGCIKVNSCAELNERYLYATQNRSVIMYDKMAPMSTADSTAGAMKKGDAMPGFASTDYSTTNIQVAGVDEADVIKNDGKYIYMIKGETVRIIDAYPANTMKELVKIKLTGVHSDQQFFPTEMYVDGNALIIIGSLQNSYIYSNTSSSISYSPFYYANKTKVFILDMTDHLNPTVKRSVEFDANYTTSRKINNTLYLVMNQYIGTYYPMDSQNANDNVNNSFESLLPQMTDSSKKATTEAIAGCSDFIILPKPKTSNLVITAAVPLNDLTKDVSRTVIVGNSENVYASPQNLYIASTDWRGSFHRSFAPSNTALYKFSLANGMIQYKTVGYVPGTILNQFSMDEYDGMFRIATQKERDWRVAESTSSSNLYVLDTNMSMVGKLENIAPGEQMYASRFLGKRAFMVTFKHIDPLFVVNLSDPKNPKIEGQLKIPGYSTYLHPYDENHLIGFGQDVDESIDADKVHDSSAVYYTAVQGLKMGLFDITDVSHPTEMFKEIIGSRGTTSEVLTNHKALLFNKDKNLLAFPVSVTTKLEDTCIKYTYTTCPTTCQKTCVPSNCTLTNGIQVCTIDCNGANSCSTSSYETPTMTFVGVYVYNLDLTKGFTLKGEITHVTDKELQDMQDPSMMSSSYPVGFDKIIQRIIYIGENLYTISQSMVKANDMTTIIEKNILSLGGQ